jgi:hypothetical protein
MLRGGQLKRCSSASLSTQSEVSLAGLSKLNSKWRWRDGKNPSVDTAKDADQQVVNFRAEPHIAERLPVVRSRLPLVGFIF